MNGPPDGAPLGSAVPEGAPQPSVRVIEWGPLRAAVELRWPRVGAGSSIRQVVSLAAGARMLEFETDVEWRESHRMLKARFPLDIHADEACYISEPRPPASRAPSRVHRSDRSMHPPLTLLPLSRDAVRACAPPCAHKHQLGLGQVRGVRAPLGGRW